MIQATESKTKNILKVMFIYWISIILWQTVRPVANRSLVDTLVKITLLFPTILYSLRHNKLSQGGMMLFYSLVFVLTQCITLLFDTGSFGLSQVITVVFMVMQIVIFLILLYREPCKARMVERFCAWLVTVAAIMSVYNVIFNFRSFSHTFSGGGGSYGYECASFLYSNHEFGLYLSTAIISLFWLFLKKKVRTARFLLALSLLLVNLLSTYSRTAILGLLVALFLLTFFYNKKVFLYLLIISAVCFALIVNIEFLDDLIFKSVLKGTFNNDGVMDEERASMYTKELEAFKQGDLIQKLFGQGYAGASRYEGHNAYLVILLTGGVCMFAFFLFVIAFGLYKAFGVLRRDALMGALLLGYIAFALLYMMAQTPILFYSSMDSFFITMIAIMVPLYVSNGMKNAEKFYEGTTN